MFLLTTTSAFLEIAIFLLAVLTFVLAIRFFIESQRKLAELLPASFAARTKLKFWFDRSGFVVPNFSSTPPSFKKFFRPAPVAKGDTDVQNRLEIEELKHMLRQQQEELSKAVKEIQNLQHIGTTPAADDNLLAAETAVEELEYELMKKDGEIKSLKQQISQFEHIQEGYETMQHELEQVQAKVQRLEQEAMQGNEIVNKLEQAETTIARLHTEIGAKEDRLLEMASDVEEIKWKLEETKRLLAETEVQNHHLTARLQLFETIDSEMKELSDYNRKLKAEAGRIAELESMLQMIKDERDNLLQKKKRSSP